MDKRSTASYMVPGIADTYLFIYLFSFKITMLHVVCCKRNYKRSYYFVLNIAACHILSIPAIDTHNWNSVHLCFRAVVFSESSAGE